MQRHIEQSALPDDGDSRHATERLRMEPAIGIDQTQAAGSFGDQHPSIRQERQPPRVFQAFSHRDGVKR